MWKVVLAVVVVLLLSSTEAWQIIKNADQALKTRVIDRTAALVVGALLPATLVLLPTNDAWATDTAAQISLRKLPPTSINVEIKDLPVVGKLLSGTYSKVPNSVEIDKPSIIIKSPDDKAKAIQNLVKNGHLEFDVCDEYHLLRLDYLPLMSLATLTFSLFSYFSGTNVDNNRFLVPSILTWTLMWLLIERGTPC